MELFAGSWQFLHQHTYVEMARCFLCSEGASLNLARIAKLAQVIQSARLTRALVYHRVLAGAEHRRVLSRDLTMVIDIGANRGQFALAVRRWAPAARIISFEPLPGPSSVFRNVFEGDNQVKLYQIAIGPNVEQRAMHLSKRDDSSSLLPISSVQSSMFPGTSEVALIDVPVGPLSEFVCADELTPRSMLKLDVQGFEYEALLGCESLLAHFEWIYCECSFIELYAGQRLASDVIALLADQGFSIDDLHNPVYSDAGRCIQADLLFSRSLSKVRIDQRQLASSTHDACP